MTRKANKKPGQEVLSLTQAQVKKHLKLHGLLWSDFNRWYAAYHPFETEEYDVKAVEAYVDWRLGFTQ